MTPTTHEQRPPVADAARRDRFRAWFLALCLMFGTLQAITAWTWGLPALESWAVDSIGGHRIVDWVRNGLRATEWDARYPSGHRALLAAVYAPWLLLEEPPGDLEARVAWNTRLLRVGRLVTVLMSVGILLALYRIGRTLGPPGAGLLAASLWTGCYSAIYLGITTKLDVPYVFWSVLAVERVVAYHRRGTLWPLVASGVFAALAVGTKDQAAGFVAAIPILLGWRSPGLVSERAPNLRHVALWLVVSALAYGIVSQALIRPSVFVEHLNVTFGPGLVNYRVDLDWGARLAIFVRSALSVGHIPFLAATIVGAVVAAIRRPRVTLWLALPGLTYVALFLMPSRLLGTRFLLPVVISSSLIAGIGLACLLRSSRSWLVVATAMVVFVSGGSMYFAIWQDTRAAADRWMRARPEVTESLATHCRGGAYLPALAKIHARVVVPEDGWPTEADEDYLLVPHAGVLDRYLAYGEPDAAAAWRDLIEGRAGYEVVARFEPPGAPPPWQRFAGRQVGVNGLDAPILMLRRKPIAPRSGADPDRADGLPARPTSESSSAPDPVR